MSFGSDMPSMQRGKRAGLDVVQRSKLAAAKRFHNDSDDALSSDGEYGKLRRPGAGKVCMCVRARSCLCVRAVGMYVHTSLRY